ncbi:MAG: hypothetical protein ACO3UU_14965 [Minisyncoccia bacterium]
MRNKSCPVCNIFLSYKWNDEKIEKFNKFIKNEYRRDFTEYQREILKFEFSILVEDIAQLSFYNVTKHRKECIANDDIAVIVGDHDPDEFLTRKEARELISNFRQLDYRDKKSVAAQNWLEVVTLLIASTKKNIERNIANQSKHILDYNDMKIAKLIIDTFKVPTFEVDIELKNVSDKEQDYKGDKFKGKLDIIKNMLSKN